MKLDDSLVTNYLNGRGEDNRGHWLFSPDEAEHLPYEPPAERDRTETFGLLRRARETVGAFEPFNAALFGALFPLWRGDAAEAEVLLSAGAPEPYDAMVRTHGGREYMIFDLVRFLQYARAGHDPAELIRGMLTHELAHVCLHRRFPPSAAADHGEKLRYVVFDEGFAHFLALREDAPAADFSVPLAAHYGPARRRLREALAETDPVRRAADLAAADAGAFWEKFAAVAGMLFLARRRENIPALYAGGPDAFVRALLDDPNEEKGVFAR